MAETTLVVISGADVAVQLDKTPQHILDRMARVTLHAIDRYFAIPKVQEDYKKWLLEYKKQKGR